MVLSPHQARYQTRSLLGPNRGQTREVPACKVIGTNTAIDAHRPLITFVPTYLGS